MGKLINITSKDGSIYKELAKLDRKKYRDENSLFKIEGPNLVREAVLSGVDIKSLVINKDKLTPEIEQIVDSASSKTEYENVNIIYMQDNLFGKLSDSQNPQGIFAVAMQKIFSEEEFFLDSGGKNFVLLDSVQDPGNVGSIVRTAEAAGYGGIIFAGASVDFYSPKVVRACAGSIFRVKAVRIKEITKAVDFLKRHGKEIVCLALEGEKIYCEEKLTENIGLVLGNEGNGVSEEALAKADKIVKIPMAGEIESLNVAIAGAIVMYENMRTDLGGITK